MKKLLQSYASLSKAERMGFMALSILLVVFITVRLSMPLWARPHADVDNEKRIVADWQKNNEHEQPKPESEPEPKVTTATEEPATEAKNTDPTAAEWQDAASIDLQPSLPSVININTADSATLVRLKGIGPATAHKIIARRESEGPFTDIEQLKDVSRIPAKTFEKLRSHLSAGRR